MKTILVLVSCFALTFLASARAEPNPPEKKKKSAQSAEAAQQKPAPKAYGAAKAGGGPPRYTAPQGHHNVGIGQGLGRSSGATPGKLEKKEAGAIGGPGDRGGTKHKMTTAQGTAGAKFKPQRFNLASKSKPVAAKAPAATFRQGARIRGSQNWTGSSYGVFRNYSPVWHDRGWWHNHYNNIVFVFGGWYYWNSNYWYPAWGYAPNAYYFYDGPIYAYNDLPPDQVIANVQAALQQQGYYQGEVDGILGPLTRAAIARYQEDHGLYATSAIDEPTLASLGMT